MLIISGLCLAGFIIVFVLVETGVFSPFETVVSQIFLNGRNRALTGFLTALTHLGDPAAVILACAALWLWKPFRPNRALFVSAAVLASAGLNLLIKHWIARPRPLEPALITETGYSFPSGHAMSNMALYLTVFLLLCILGAREKGAVWLSVLCIFMPLSIGISRIYLGVHYAGDVLGGWMLGASAAFAAAAAFSLVFSHGTEVKGQNETKPHQEGN